METAVVETATVGVGVMEEMAMGETAVEIVAVTEGAILA